MALPSVVPLGPTPSGLERSDIQQSKFDRRAVVDEDDAEFRLVCNGATFRVHALGDLDAHSICAVLPLDALFDVRIAAARRLWLALNGRDPGANPAALSPYQRNHFVDALRALDAQLDGATYRQIAVALFGAMSLPERGWKTHDLRDRAIRLVRLGHDLMQGGYRQLLLYPFRQRHF